MCGHLYRMNEINQIEKRFHVEKLKQESITHRLHCGINFSNACLLIIQFFIILLGVGCLSSPSKLVGMNFGII